MTLRLGTRLFVWGWAVLSLFAIYVRGQHVGIDRNVSSRLRFHAIPVAISVLYHGRAYDHTAFSSIAFPFQDTQQNLDARIAGAIAQKIPADDPTYYWVADDRGMGEYVIAAFALFGPKTHSLYVFCFVVLGLSVALFLADLGWHSIASATLLFALAALYTCVSVIPLGNLTLPIFEAPALFEPRVMELLSYVATLHLALTAFLGDRWTPWRGAIVLGQALILVACYHARSSIGWQLVFVLSLAAIAIIWRSLAGTVSQPQRGWRWRASLAWPLLCVVVSLGLLKTYQHVTYNPRYFRDMGARTVWHNALMGVWLDAHLAGKYQLAVNDSAVVQSVVTYLQVSHDPRLTPEWSEGNALGSLGGHGSFDWFIYEGAARDLYWHIWRTDTLDALRLYLLEKPREILGVLTGAVSPPSGLVRDLPGARFNPFALVSLILIAPAVVLVCTSDGALIPMLGASLWLFACSLLPGWMFYPVVHTMLGAFATVTLICYLGLALCAASVVAVVRPRNVPS